MKTFFMILGCLIIIPLYLLGLGAIVAFLWNFVIVDSLHATTNTLNLWSGTGLVLLINIIAGFFRGIARKS